MSTHGTCRLGALLAAFLFASVRGEAAPISVGSQLGDGLSRQGAGTGTWTGFAYSMRTTLDGVADPAPANESTSWYKYGHGSVPSVTLQSPLPLAKTPDGRNVNLYFGENLYGPSVSGGEAKNLLAAPYSSERDGAFKQVEHHGDLHPELKRRGRRFAVSADTGRAAVDRRTGVPVGDRCERAGGAHGDGRGRLPVELRALPVEFDVLCANLGGGGDLCRRCGGGLDPCLNGPRALGMGALGLRCDGIGRLRAGAARQVWAGVAMGAVAPQANLR